MSHSKTLSKIPVVLEGMRVPSASWHGRRRAVQAAVILALILVPVTGLFRIDPVAGAFVVLDRQIWFSDFFIVVGFWLAVSSGLVVTYSTLGTAFCGWACPQNSLSEWGNRLTQKWLGKRAEVSLTGEKMRVSSGKNKWYNWLILTGSFVAVAMLAALVPLLYFYPPSAIWSFITLKNDARLAGSLHWIYTVFVLIILLDIAFIRHFFCRFMCIYKVWQHSFKTKQTLHIAHDVSHADECAKCNFCVSSCFVGIDPRQTETYDTCVNCGECISACAAIRGRKQGESLLRFEWGQRPASGRTWHNSVGSLLGRVRWTLPLLVLGLAMFVWGLSVYQPYHLSAGRLDNTAAVTYQDYRIVVANKRYNPVALDLTIEGLAPSDYRLERSRVVFSDAGRQEIILHIEDSIAPGLHPVLIKLSAADGWQQSFRIMHYTAKKS